MALGIGGKLSSGVVFRDLCDDLGIDMDSSVLSLVRGIAAEPVMSKEWADRALAAFIWPCVR